MRKYFIITVLFISGIVFSQEIKLDEVTLQELSEKSDPNDSSSVAKVLFEKGKTFFEYKQGNGFFVITEVEVKIKIYKKEGYDYANKAIEYYIGGNSDESVDFSKAYTYNLVGGKIEKTKLKSDGEFQKEKNKFWAEKKISMPNVKEGSIIEYKYTIKSPYASNLPEWKFQRQIPVVYSEYVTNVPKYFTYNVYRKGTLKINETKTSKNKSFTLTEKEISSGRNGKAYETYTKTIEYIDNVVEYKIQNVPPLKEEKFVNNIDNYCASVQHELASTEFEGGEYKKYSVTWDDVVKSIYENSDFGSQLNKTGYFEEDITALVKNANSDAEKIMAVFNYVKAYMKWNNFRGYICDVGVRDAYKNKVGNVAEINLMLTAMLRFVGIQANPVLLSTRDNGIAFFPNRNAYNYVIAGIENGENTILLDATNFFTEPNILPLQDLNWFGRMIRKDGSSLEINLNPKFISKEFVKVMATMKANGEISGKLNKQSSEYNALVYRINNANLTVDSYLEKLEKKYNNIQVSDYNVQHKTELGNPVVESFSFVDTNSVGSVGGKLYFSPLLFFTQTVNPFQQEKREYPVDFSFPFQDRYLFIIEIPEGYKVESTPKPLNLGFSDNSISFKFNINNDDKKITLSVVMDTNSSIYSPQDYEELKAFYEEMIKKQTEKVILQKI